MTDLTGQRFNQWTVLGFSHFLGTRYYWDCRCDCGTEKKILSPSLKNGDSKSCGCHRDKLASERALTHGMTKTPEHSAWISMRSRCSNPKVPNFPNYGGRGIKVCERWDSFELFLQDMGKKPSNSHSLDRKEVDGNYEPGNVRWATKQEQTDNRRCSKTIPMMGRNQSLAAWCRELAVNYGYVHRLITHKGYRAVDAISKALVFSAFKQSQSYGI